MMDMKMLEQLERKYESAIVTLSDFLNRLEEKYLQNFKKEKSILPNDVVIPDKNYVKSLISYISEVKIDGLERELNHLETGLKKIAETGDFSDAEDTMGRIHETIEKYIYRSNTKVSAEDWKKLEAYLEKAGYCAVPINVGDDITPYKTYFARPISTSGGKTNTIKQIQLKPYILKFYDGEEIGEILKLCGKCTYYQ